MYFSKADHYFSFYELFGEYLQELHILVDQIPNLALPPQKKPRRGGDLRQINTCRQVPLQVSF